MLKRPATLLFTLCLLLLITAALWPAVGAAQTPPPMTINIPSGSYRLSCNTCKFSGNYDYTCKCSVYNNFMSSVPSWVSTKITLGTCTKDSSGFYNLANNQGKLTCATS